MATTARSSYLDEEEDHGERFVSPFKMERFRHENLAEEEPVLKRAASVFFADLAASSASNDSQNLDASASFLRPPWASQAQEKPPAGVLDPLLPPDDHQQAICYKYLCDPVSQYHNGWKTFGPAAPGVYHHLLDEDQFDYNLLNDSFPHFACNESLEKKPEESFESRPNDEVLELLYSRIPTQDEELEQDLDFGDFLDGFGSDKLDFLDPGHGDLQGECGEDCEALVSSINNLSKVLLAHYSSKASILSPARSNNIRSIQSAILDLSRCLLVAHRQTNPVEEPAPAHEEPVNEVEEDEKPVEEQTLSSDETKPEEPEEESNEELMARFRVLLGLSSKKPDSPEESCVEDNFKAFYLNGDQVEQRLALLKTRPNWNEEGGVEQVEGSATIKKEVIQFEDDYIAKAPAAGVAPQAEKETIVYSVGVDKFPSDSEESGWEHI